MAIIPPLSARLKRLIVASQPCKQCACPGPHRVTPGTGPHRAALRCGECGAFVQWLSQMAVDILAVLDEGEVQP